MKLVTLFLFAVAPAFAQNVSLQKIPPSDGNAPNALTGPSKVIVVPSGGSITATGSGTIVATGGSATTVPWSGVTSTPTTLGGYGITDAVPSSRTVGTTAPLTGGGPLSGNLTLAMPAAGSGVNGYLTAADWAAFTAKEAVLTFSPPLSRSLNAVSIPAATGSVDGYLASSDWTSFTNKVPNTRTISTTGPLTGGGALTSNLTVTLPVATGSADGYLASGDWTTFNGKAPSTRTISTTAPLTGGGDLSANRTIAIPAATTSVNGYLTSTDWTTFNSKQASGNYLTALTGDGTAAGPGSAALTLATVNANVGTFGGATTSPTFTVDGKGRLTAASSQTVTPAWTSITSKPTTIAGYAISDAYTITQVNTLVTTIPQINYFYVDSVNGNDANSGTLPTAPLKTIAALLTKSPPSGSTINLARGSTWLETLGLLTKDNVTFTAYGKGARPLFDCADPITSTWTLSSGQTNVWQTAVTIPTGVNLSSCVWDNNASASQISRLRNRASIALVEANLGSFFYSGGILYVSTLAGTQPTSGEISVAMRRDGIEAGNNARVSHINLKRGQGNDGSLFVGLNSWVEYCNLSDGSKHNMYISSGTVKDCNLFGQAWPDEYGGYSAIAFNFDGAETLQPVRVINCKSKYDWPATVSTSFITFHAGSGGTFDAPYFEGNTIDSFPIVEGNLPAGTTKTYIGNDLKNTKWNAYGTPVVNSSGNLYESTTAAGSQMFSDANDCVINSTNDVYVGAGPFFYMGGSGARSNVTMNFTNPRFVTDATSTKVIEWASGSTGALSMHGAQFSSPAGNTAVWLLDIPATGVTLDLDRNDYGLTPALAFGGVAYSLNGWQGATSQDANSVTTLIKTENLFPAVGLNFNGQSTNSRLRVFLPSVTLLDAAARTLRFRLKATSTPTTDTPFLVWGSSTAPTANFLEFTITNSKDLKIRLYAASTGNYRQLVFSQFLNRWRDEEVWIEFGADAAGYDLRVNGLTATSVVETTVGTPPTNWIGQIDNGLIYCTSLNKLFYRISGLTLISSRISAQDEREFCRDAGIPPARFRWGATQAGGLLAQGVGNSWGYGAADSSTNITAASATLVPTTVAGQRTGGAGSYYVNLAKTGTASQSAYMNRYVPNTWEEGPTQTINVKVWAKINGTPPTTVNAYILPAGTTGNDGLNTTQTLTGINTTWQQFSFTWVVNYGNGVLNSPQLAFNIPDGDATTSVDIDDLEILPVGVVFYLPCDDGAGLQITDRSSNALHGIIAADSISHAVRSINRVLTVRGWTNTSGNVQLCGANCIAADLASSGAQITRVRARAHSGTPTVTLGTASGGAQVVASVALSTTWKVLTIALTDGIVTGSNTGAGLWVNSNSTDMIDWAVEYDLLTP